MLGVWHGIRKMGKNDNKCDGCRNIDRNCYKVLHEYCACRQCLLKGICVEICEDYWKITEEDKAPDHEYHKYRNHR